MFAVREESLDKTVHPPDNVTLTKERRPLKATTDVMELTYEAQRLNTYSAVTFRRYLDPAPHKAARLASIDFAEYANSSALFDDAGRLVDQARACNVLEEQLSSLQSSQFPKLNGQGFECASAMADTPTIDKYLNEISRILREKNGSQLQDYLVIEPPLPQLYHVLITELRQFYSKGAKDSLEEKCQRLLPECSADDDSMINTWSSFVSFLALYFRYLRDVNFENLLETHELLAELVNQSISALGDVHRGVVVLPTVLSLSRTLARLTLDLDKRPELTAQWKQRQVVTSSGGDSDSRSNLVEETANTIRRGFTTCLNERTGGIGVARDGKLEGKKSGIYYMANLCLKLYFACHQTRNALEIFENIYNQAPPLPYYPASHRVSYLYYLGRFLFSNNHFYRAQLALEAAYTQCHARAHKQRRLMLIYLITSNIILGRFPSAVLLDRPETEGLGAKFWPFCKAIAQGDIARFRQIFDRNGEHTDWFIHKGIFLPLRNRCEVLVWRSLARRTFLLNGFKGDETKRAPNFDLHDLLQLGIFLEKRALTPSPLNVLTNGHRAPHTNSIFITPLTPTTPEPPSYTDPDLADIAPPATPLLPNMLFIESITASLVTQGLLYGYISHKLLKFVVLGAKQNPAMAIRSGFPNPWEIISAKADKEVPGWRKEERSGGAGRVVNLTGARPAGSL
ncbi:MAG: hypothetical protein M1827_007503 [Pycnora praestabilis]|nr:MAG: hypothetical protein M1827_007503 [Pycnora praestabilis]